MSKAKPLILTIYVELYKVYLIIAFETDEGTLKKHLSRHTPLDPMDLAYLEEGHNGRFRLFDSGIGIIQMKSYPREPESIADLNHELAHATFQILRRAGLELSLYSEEAYTYLMGFLTKKVYEHLKKK